MTIEENVNKFIDILHELGKSIESMEIDEKKETIEKLNFIENNYIKKIPEFFKKVQEGDIMYMQGCFNNYEFTRTSLIYLVKLLNNHWNETLEEIRLRLLDTLYSIRRILIDMHNKNVPYGNPEERINQYDPSKNRVLFAYDLYYEYGLLDLLKKKIETFKEDELNSEEVKYMACVKNILAPPEEEM